MAKRQKEEAERIAMAKRQKEEAERIAMAKRQEEEAERIAMAKRQEATKYQDQEEDIQVTAQQIEFETSQNHRDYEALSQSLEDELSYDQLINDQQAIQHFSEYILQAVTKKWSRPPSARTGMKVKLRIYLLPTGDINQVDILASSGNVAFDQSAVRAVNRVGRFRELMNLSPRLFDSQFRKFILDFDPDDLRL